MSINYSLLEESIIVKFRLYQKEKFVKLHPF